MMERQPFSQPVSELAHVELVFDQVCIPTSKGELVRVGLILLRYNSLPCGIEC